MRCNPKAPTNLHSTNLIIVAKLIDSSCFKGLFRHVCAFIHLMMMLELAHAIHPFAIRCPSSNEPYVENPHLDAILRPCCCNLSEFIWIEKIATFRGTDRDRKYRWQKHIKVAPYWVVKIFIYSIFWWSFIRWATISVLRIRHTSSVFRVGLSCATGASWWCWVRLGYSYPNPTWLLPFRSWDDLTSLAFRWFEGRRVSTEVIKEVWFRFAAHSNWT